MHEKSSSFARGLLLIGATRLEGVHELAEHLDVPALVNVLRSHGEATRAVVQRLHGHILYEVAGSSRYCWIAGDQSSLPSLVMTARSLRAASRDALLRLGVSQEVCRSGIGLALGECTYELQAGRVVLALGTTVTRAERLAQDAAMRRDSAALLDQSLLSMCAEADTRMDSGGAFRLEA